jgi:hypothetical protein
MTRPSIEAVVCRADLARQKKRLVARLRALGCDPRGTLGGIEARARRDLRNLSAQARPAIKSGESLRPRRRA